MQRMAIVRSLLISGVAGLLMTGCAGTAPKPEFQQELDVQSRIDVQDETVVNVTASDGVDILDMEKSRIAQRLQERITTKKQLNPATDAPTQYRVELLLTRYDKGNAFARAMMAGLGQIHVNGTVTVFAEPDGRQITRFDIKKRFAWGGIYGGATGMEDIERTFADGIAAALTGQAEDAPPEKAAGE